jgi:hypothetical protein
MPPLAERIDAALNPLMVKEAHQSFRNRVFIGVGVLALLVPLVMFGFSLITEGFDMNSESAGQGFFGLISGFFGIIAVAVVPARTVQQFQAEIKSRTIDLILLTGLSPWDLASGRFQAAGLLLVVLLAFIAPFAVASTLMGGMGIERVVPSLLFLLVLGLAQCSAAVLAVSTMVVSRRLGAAALIAFAFQSITLLSTSLVAINAPFFHRTIGLFAWSLLLIALVTLLFLRLSADLITPGAVRTYARSKAIMLALVAAFFVPLWIASRALSMSSSDQDGLLAIALSWFGGFAVIWSGAAPRAGSGGRLGPLLANGFLATTVYATTTMLIVGGVSHALGWPGWIALYFVVYFLFFVGLAALIQTFWFVRNAEGFFAGLLVCIVLNVLTSVIVEAQHGWNPGYKPSALAVFLPTSWGSAKERVLTAWFAMPALVGALAMFAAHRRRSKIWHE